MQNRLEFNSELFKEHKFVMPKRMANVTFLLIYHSVPDDLPLSLRQHFEDSDLVLHEQVAYTDNDVQTLQDIANGTRQLDSSEHPMNIRRAELTANTGAKQRVWDVPAAHLSAGKYSAYFTRQLGEMIRNSYGNPDAATQLFETYFQMIHGRDKIGLRNIRREIDSYESEQTPNVLVVAGLSHIGMANTFRAEAEKVNSGTNVTITTSYQDMAFGAMARFMADKYTGNVDYQRSYTSFMADETNHMRMPMGTPSHLVNLTD